MTDKLEFKLIDPVQNGEKWADDEIFVRKDLRAVEIYLNGHEIIDILKEIEMPFALDEGHPDIAGGYGHNEPKILYRDLSESLVEGTYNQKYGVELLCCGSCGFSGCWSAVAYVRRDDDFVYWENFKQNHRENWKYDLSYKFDRNEYEKQMEKLKKFTEESGEWVFKKVQ